MNKCGVPKDFQPKSLKTDLRLLNASREAYMRITYVGKSQPWSWEQLWKSGRSVKSQRATRTQLDKPLEQSCDACYSPIPVQGRTHSKMPAGRIKEEIKVFRMDIAKEQSLKCPSSQRPVHCDQRGGDKCLMGCRPPIAVYNLLLCGTNLDFLFEAEYMPVVPLDFLWPRIWPLADPGSGAELVFRKRCAHFSVCWAQMGFSSVSSSGLFPLPLGVCLMVVLHKFHPPLVLSSRT